MTEAVLHETVLAIIMKQVEVCARTRRAIQKAHSSGLVAAERDRLQADIRKLRMEIDGYDAKTMRVYNDLCDGILSESDYRIISERYEADHAAALARIDELEAALARLQPAFVDENPSITEFEKYADIKELTRDVLTALVKRIDVNHDLSIDIAFRYMDEYAPLLAFAEENGGIENV